MGRSFFWRLQKQSVSGDSISFFGSLLGADSTQDLCVPSIKIDINLAVIRIDSQVCPRLYKTAPASEITSIK